MENYRIYLGLSIFLIILGLIYQAYAFNGFGSPTNGSWSNVSWNYRVRLEINSTGVNRTNWPIEHVINFTDLLPAGTFDINSTRVYENDAQGRQLQEVPSQFEPATGFDAATNAIGTLSFIMNGTSQANQTRIFYIYYDYVQHGVKPAANYTGALNYTWTGRFLNISNSIINVSINTNAFDNTSGIYRVRENQFQNVILSAPLSQRTAEYIEYSNSTTNLTFDLRNNASFYSGPVRTVVTQEGPEIAAGLLNTSQGKIVKKYIFYRNAGPEQDGSFLKISVVFTNTVNVTIQRNSTASGALALDANRTLSSGSIDTLAFDSNDPYSYAWASGLGGELIGIININESVQNFSATYSSNGRIGINLNSTSIQPNQTLEHTAVLYFGIGGSNGVTEFLDVRSGFQYGAVITQFSPEWLQVETKQLISPAVYNRNESILVRANMTQSDPYNLTYYVNATIDNGTLSVNDDTTVQLFDDGTGGDIVAGDRIFTRNVSIPNDANVTEWSVNITAYEINKILLNATIAKFNVTDVLNLTINITNPNVLVGRLVTANVTVKNFRNDAFIGGAVLSCYFGSTNIVNKTDLGNGIYAINFSAPASQSSFTLLCNATRSGNIGNGTSQFFTEVDRTNVSIILLPPVTNVTNITVTGNETFPLSINATNYGNGTAATANITLQLPANWYYAPQMQNCTSISIGSSCVQNFNVTVAAGTLPGAYTFNVTVNWTNPDGSFGTNLTQGSVTVTSNPRIVIPEANITNQAGDGVTSIIGNFTVISFGNDVAGNITFSCIAGTGCTNFSVSFEPANISFLNFNTNRSVRVNVTVPLGFTPGTYNATINASSNNSVVTVIFISVPSATNVSISFFPSSYNISNLTTLGNETFSLSVNATNIINGSARFVNVSLAVPSNWSYSNQIEFCGNLTKLQNCTRSFNVTIPSATLTGNYAVNASVFWVNADGTTANLSSRFNVTVFSNPFINLSVTNISSSSSDNITTAVGNFTVFSIGNDIAQNITFSCAAGIVCQNFSMSFEPANISSIISGSSSTVKINVTVPYQFPTGDYNGTVNVSSATNKQTLLVLISINPNRVWSASPLNCQRSQNPTEGTACSVIVNNLGNINTSFTVTPAAANQTNVSATAFTIGVGSNYTFSILYNVTGAPSIYYNSTYTIQATQPATPQSTTVNVTLIPYTPPFLNISLNATKIEQNTSLQIDLNVTDRTNSGIAFVRANVTLPNGTVYTAGLNLVNQTGNFSQWRLVYKNATLNQSTLLAGNYSVTIYVQDNTGNDGNITTSFIAHAKLSITVATLTNKYFQGDTGSIFYIARDLSGAGLENVSVSIKIYDASGNISYSSSAITLSDGTISPLPSFVLASDSPVGNYTLTTNSTYFDTTANITVSKIATAIFEVTARTVTVTGLFADVETAVVWFPNNIMRFNVLVYDGQGAPVDATALNLTVYDPAGNVYFSVTNITQLTRLQKGLYQYQFAMPVSTATGMYLAIVDVTQNSFETMKLKAFRVASGGPYDVRLNLLRTDASPGGQLDFVLTIENKGEVSQDVFIDYSVVSTNNQTYYTASEAVYTPSISNQTFNRNALIFSNQPLGTYILNARVRYDNVQPAINANASFVVVSSASNVTTTPPPSGGGSVPPITIAVTESQQAARQTGILITKYNSNITLSRGFTRVEDVTVTNVGKTNLGNVSLVLIGIPTSWYTVTPASYTYLTAANSTVFLVEFKIPVDADLGEKIASFLVTGGSLSDQKAVRVTILKSIEDVLKGEMADVESKFSDLMIEVKVAEREGKDTSKVRILTDEIEKRIQSAKDKFDKKDYENVYGDLDTARNLIDKAYDVLNTLTLAEVQVIPLWIILLILLLVFGSTSTVVFMWKKKMPIHLPHIAFKMPAAAPKKENTHDIQLGGEREKLIRMLNVLENEKREGIITQHTYEEMKRSMQSRLDDLDRRLKK